MATLNTSSNGPSITQSYQKIVNAPAPSGPAASSPTYGQWAVYSVKAPLANAFTNDSGKESVLNVQTTGEGELVDLIEEFSDGRIQFAFVKVKDTNTGLPKNALIAWCGEGVPERTKGYFGSHLGAVSKILHGYHVQVTARSDRDLTPEVIVQKVADASGSKYGGGGGPDPAPAASSGPPPPAASKPVFMPTRTGGGAAGGFNPLGSRARAAPQSSNTDEDGWGADAPQVTRSQLEKVAPAYKPTRVNMNELTSQKPEPSRFQAAQQGSNGAPDVVKGAYQPIGKVDINEIRRQAQQSSSAQDDRPTTVKGAYEPVGKVDIAAIRAKAQGAPPPAAPSAGTGTQDEQDERPKSLADRSAAFTSSERMTALPKPKVANRFGAGASNFTGTKAPAPGGFEAKPLAGAAPVGTASRTFADEGGKTPAQIWAEKKGRQRGTSGAAENQPISPVRSQASGGWQSGYAGKSWAPVQTTKTGGSGVSAQRTGQDEPQEEEEAAPSSPPAGGVSAIRDRFKNAPTMAGPGMARDTSDDDQAPPPPPLATSSKPNAGVRGVPMPGLPQRPQEQPDEERQDLPPPPAVPRTPTPEPEEEVDEGSPVRIAMPVSRSAQPEPIEPAGQRSSPPMPTDSLDEAVSQQQEQDMEPEPQIAGEDPSRAAGQHAAASTFGAAHDTRGAGSAGGKTAIAQYDYEKAEENELELKENERITDIEMVDEDWWMGRNTRGETGLFPSNYVELVDDDNAGGAAQAPPPPAQAEEQAAPPAGPPRPTGAASGPTATAQYDYEAAEDNELSFPDGAKVTDLVSCARVAGTRVVLIFLRSSLTMTGGTALTVADLASSRPTTCSWMSRLII